MLYSMVDGKNTQKMLSYHVVVDRKYLKYNILWVFYPRGKSRERAMLFSLVEPHMKCEKLPQTLQDTCGMLLFSL